MQGELGRTMVRLGISKFEGADSCSGRISERRVAVLDRSCQTLVGCRKDVVRDGV